MAAAYPRSPKIQARIMLSAVDAGAECACYCLEPHVGPRACVSLDQLFALDPHCGFAYLETAPAHFKLV